MSKLLESFVDAARQLAEVNPMLIIVVFSVIFVIVVVLKGQWLNLALGAWTALCLAILLTPGGRSISEHTQHMPETLPRIKCFGKALVSGALWDREAVIRAKDCDSRGIGFQPSTDRASAERTLQRSRGAIANYR